MLFTKTSNYLHKSCTPTNNSSTRTFPSGERGSLAADEQAAAQGIEEAQADLAALPVPALQ
jgi:hypothetical protein